MTNATTVRELDSLFVDARIEVNREAAAVLGVPQDWTPEFDDPAGAVLCDQSGRPWKSLRQIAEVQPMSLDLRGQDLSNFDGVMGEVELTNVFWKSDDYGPVPLQKVVVTYRMDVIEHVGGDLGTALGEALVRRFKEGRLRTFDPAGGPATALPRFEEDAGPQPVIR